MFIHYEAEVSAQQWIPGVPILCKIVKVRILYTAFGLTYFTP